MKSAGAKVLALFLVSTMVLSSIAYFTGSGENKERSPPYTIISFNGVHFTVVVPDNSTGDVLWLVIDDIKEKYRDETDTPIIDFFDDRDVAQKGDNGYYDEIPEGDPRIDSYYMHWLGQYTGRTDELYYFNYSERINYPEREPRPEKYSNPKSIDFLDVGGRLVNEPFSSIVDALRMTPDGVEMAEYVDIEAISESPAGPFIRSQLQMGGLGVNIINILDGLYGANTTRMYFATFKESNGSFLLMTTFEPKVVRFDFIPKWYGSYNVLQRMDTGRSNVLGNPTIFGPERNVLATLDVIEGANRNTSYTTYETVLLEAPRAEYQRVTDNTTFADQFYIGLTAGENNTLVRTTIYLNPRVEVVEKIKSLGANSTERGFEEYNITQMDDLMVVSIRSTPVNVISEAYK